MKREDLKKLGLTDEQVESVMTSHGQDVQALNTQVSTLQQSEKDLKGQLASRDKDLSKLQKDNKDNEDLSTQLKTLQSEYKDLEKTSAANLVKVQRDSALNTLIGQSKAKNAKAVSALLDPDKITFKDGQLGGAKEQLEALQESDPYLFDLGKKQSGYDPKGGAATKNYDSFEEAMREDDIDGFLRQQLESEEND